MDLWIRKIPKKGMATHLLVVKNLSVMQETRFQSLGREDTLEKEMATHPSILAWSIPMVRGAWWVTVRGVAKSQTQLNS